ncbi:MAG TPA: hypothetical protein VE959_00450 [Bryobacteraceae bacterium]|nr:hypothetical protein [Bryobacteraceae bacterium]
MLTHDFNGAKTICSGHLSNPGGWIDITTPLSRTRRTRPTPARAAPSGGRAGILLIGSGVSEAVLETSALLQSIPATLAAALLAAGNDPAGEAELQELRALHPNLYQMSYLLSPRQSLRGFHAEAWATAENAYTLAPWNTGATGLFAGALMRAGERRHAEELLHDLLPGDRYGTPLGLLVYSVMCSEIEQAANWAWKVLEQRDPRLIFNIALLRSPSHSFLRSSDSWSALAARLDLPLPGMNRRTSE